MNIELDIPAEELSKMVSQKIMESSIGTQINEAIKKKLESKDTWDFGRILENIVSNEMRILMCNIIKEDYTEKLKERIKKQLTDEILDGFIGKIVETLTYH